MQKYMKTFKTQKVFVVFTTVFHFLTTIPMMRTFLYQILIFIRNPCVTHQHATCR